MGLPTIEEARDTYMRVGWIPKKSSLAADYTFVDGREVKVPCGCLIGVMAADLYGVRDGKMDGEIVEKVYEEGEEAVAKSHSLTELEIELLEYGFDSGMAGLSLLGDEREAAIMGEEIGKKALEWREEMLNAQAANGQES